MKHPLVTDAIFKRIVTISQIASYGLEWAKRDNAEERGDPYELGGVETVAHQISCCLYQWFFPAIELDTAGCRDYFKLEKFPNQAWIQERLVKLVVKSYR